MVPYTSLKMLMSVVLLTPARVERSSRLMMRENELGTLETGKLADIIIAQGNPLEDIWLVSKADNIKVVMQDGKIKKNMMKGICCV